MKTKQTVFDKLKAKYGSHAAAARALKYSISHYQNLKSGRMAPGRRFSLLVDHLLEGDARNVN